MIKKDITNLRFELITSTLKGYKEVQAIFKYRGKTYKHFIFVKDGRKVNVIKQAQKQFNQDLKDGKILKSSSYKKAAPWLIVTTCALGAAAITFAGLFTYKMIYPNAGGETPIDPNFATITLDAGKGNKVETTDEQIFKFYVEKGSTFAAAFKEMNYVGADKEGNDFRYWHLENTNGNIPEDYVINDDINLGATYESVKDGCLTITTRLDQSTITFAKDKQILFSRDGATWQETPETGILLEHAGDQIYIKREAEDALGFNRTTSMFTCNSAHSISGLMNSLYNSTCPTVSEAYRYCFANDIKLCSAKKIDLGDTIKSDRAYSYMFQGCTSLTTAPELPATTLTTGCYLSMFSGCASLITAPELPAGTLASDCYSTMFNDCTSLVAAPELPAKDLSGADNCYAYMFQNCVSLTTAPELPATTLVKDCYYYMFDGCSSLVTIPSKLPATTLADACYRYMFQNCTSLLAAPVLPAENLTGGEFCYGYMFSGCSSLAQVPTLPATKLINSCYAYMFQNCVSLTTAPELPAEDLTGIASCYQYMFSGCSSLRVGQTEDAYVSNKILTVPTGATTNNFSSMFNGTSGSFQDGTPAAPNTYYYY